MRETIYVPSYGYVTKDDSFDYVGNGLFDDAINLVKDLVTSKAAKDIVVETGKNFATSVGKKAGDKLADKMFSNKVKPQANTPQTNTPQTNTPKKVKTSTELLKQIYGNGIFRQSGKGLKRS